MVRSSWSLSPSVVGRRTRLEAWRSASQSLLRQSCNYDRPLLKICDQRPAQLRRVKPRHPMRTLVSPKEARRRVQVVMQCKNLMLLLFVCSSFSSKPGCLHFHFPSSISSFHLSCDTLPLLSFLTPPSSTAHVPPSSTCQTPFPLPTWHHLTSTSCWIPIHWTYSLTHDHSSHKPSTSLLRHTPSTCHLRHTPSTSNMTRFSQPFSKYAAAGASFFSFASF